MKGFWVKWSELDFRSVDLVGGLGELREGKKFLSCYGNRGGNTLQVA